MRGLFYPVILLIVSLVILIGIVFVRPQAWWPQGPRNVAQLLEMAHPTTPMPAAKPAAATAEPTGTKSGGKRKTTQSQETVAQSSGAGIVIPTPSPEKRYPFPTIERVAAGTPETTILTAFGRPAVKVTGAETGELRERYVYVDRGTGRKTYIALVNAVVTSVQTLNP